MKKFLALCLFSTLVAGGASAQSLTILDGAYVGGFMPQAISPNGKYVGGSTLAMAMFMSEWAINDNFLVTTEFGSVFGNYGGEIRSITPDGIGVGYDDNGAVIVNFQERSYEVAVTPDPSADVYDALFDAISDDGSIITGFIYNSSLNAQACYWENGELKLLPVPSAEELGFVSEASRAVCISGDGSVIMGYVYDSLATYPMVLWFRQDDGTYKLDAVCTKYFNNEFGTEGFRRFHGLALSHDGKTVIMKLMYNAPSQEELGVNHLAYYDTTSGELTIIDVDGEHNISPDVSFDVFFHGISDDGTVVGWYEDMTVGRQAFIMKRSEMQPVLLRDAYPMIEEFTAYDLLGEHALSGISADGTIICGMGTGVDETNTPIYVGYVFDTLGDPNAAVGSLESETNEIEAIFTITGQKVSSLEKGVNIIRFTNGKTIKVIK